MKTLAILLFGLVIVVLSSCTGMKQSDSTNTAQVAQWSEAELKMLQNFSLYSQKNVADSSNQYVSNTTAIALGKELFFDTRFSKNGQIACASCHKPEQYFTDGLDMAKGLEKTRRNTPTIVGASRHTWFFHDGRSDSLWSQALGPLENELEHGGNRSQYALLTYNDSELRGLYEKVFGTMPNLSDNNRFPANAGPVKDGAASQSWKQMQEDDRQIITQIYVNIGKAIAAYESQLQPAPSRFDQYIKALSENDQQNIQSSLSQDEVAGLKLFMGKANCFICHTGPMFTDLEFHNVNTPPPEGMKFDWGRYKGAQEVLKSEFNCRSEFNDAKVKTCDELKYMVTEQHETMGSMKTPSLRNVSKTAPYMHAGQYKTLLDVVKHYNDPPPLVYRATDLLDIDLTDTEINELAAFLKSLDSEVEIGNKVATLAGK